MRDQWLKIKHKILRQWAYRQCGMSKALGCLAVHAENCAVLGAHLQFWGMLWNIADGEELTSGSMVC